MRGVRCHKCLRRGWKPAPRARKRERVIPGHDRRVQMRAGIYMGEKSAELEGVEDNALEVRRWFRSQGVSETGAARAVRLLDRTSLEQEPKPARRNRRGQFGVDKHCRYLWYRHTAKILGWCDRHQFPSSIRDILCRQYFPSPSAEDEEARTLGSDFIKATISRTESAGDFRNYFEWFACFVLRRICTVVVCNVQCGTSDCLRAQSRL